VPAFIGIGKHGRRTISCDDGQTWRNDISADDNYRCFTGGNDCDHHALSSTSLQISNGVVMRSLGWGAPGTFERSTDGVTWQQVHMGTTVQGILMGPSRWVGASRSTVRSSDQGLTWASGPTVMLSSGGTNLWNVRSGYYAEGSYIVVAQDGSNIDWQVSRDEGATWQKAVMTDGSAISACGNARITSGNNIFVSMTSSIACVSTDQGRRWERVTFSGSNINAGPLWTGSEFMAWSSSQVYRSANGRQWTSTPLVYRLPTGGAGQSVELDPITRSPQGTFVAVRGGWNQWYEQQRFYRSTDGITWNELPATAYKKSHPMTHLVWAEVSRSSICP
jgi:hypothetical protein